jgi:hypothetical protein
LLRVHRLTLVDETGIARGHHQPLHSGQGSDGFFGNAVGEVFIRGIVAHIFKRQDGD